MVFVSASTLRWFSDKFKYFQWQNKKPRALLKRAIQSATFIYFKLTLNLDSDTDMKIQIQLDFYAPIGILTLIITI